MVIRRVVFLIRAERAVIWAERAVIWAERAVARAPCACGAARSYVLAPGRTRGRAVVPSRARSYVGKPLRYDLAHSGTTA